MKFKHLHHFTNFWPVAWLPAQTLPNGRIVSAVSFHRWPREDKTLAVRIGTSEDKPNALRITTPGGDEFMAEPGEFIELGELTVRNPRYKPKVSGQ